jgi:GT2 family glycosyltransferase/glycosyltransferase involved in cell wall biosynthesis
VIVPTALAGERLRRLLASLEAEPPAQTIIVDNDSGDPGLAGPDREGWVGEGFAGLEVLHMGENAGFSRAVNAGARQATGNVLVLVNDDCVCDPGFVEALAAAIDPAAGVAMAAGVLREAGDPSLIDSAGIEIDQTLLAFDYLNGEQVERLDQGRAEPFGPTGGAAAFDRETFLRIGGFDERLFAFWEDVDLALRMRLEGYRCALVPQARATHEHSGTIGSGSAAKNRLMGFGRGYLLRKYGVVTLRRLPAVVARDGVIVAGQAVSDRNLAGVWGRLNGLLVGRREFEYPGALVEAFDPPGLGETLRRRKARRKRLAGAMATLPQGGSGTKRRHMGRNVPDLPSESAGRPDSPSLGAASNSQPSDPRPERALAIFHVAEMGGPARSLEDRLRWLAEETELHVLVPGAGPTADLYRDFAQVHVVDYGALTLPRTPAALAGAAVQRRRDVASLGAFLEELRPDLVVVATALVPAAQIAAHRAGIPVVLEASELLTSGRALPRRMVGRALVRAAGKRADVVFACSNAVAAEYGRATAPVITSYPPIDDRYAGGDGAAFRKRHDIPADAPLVLAAGSITERRGQEDVIDAMTLLRAGASVAPMDPVCVIAGEPFPRRPDLEFHSRMQRLAAASNGAVRLIGYVPDLADAYAAADVVVNPRRDPEAFGRVHCEALVAGTPIVVARTGAVAEVLRDGETALLVPPSDPPALARAIATLLEDPELGRRLAERGRADVLTRFSATAARDRFAEGLRLAVTR